MGEFDENGATVAEAATRRDKPPSNEAGLVTRPIGPVDVIIDWPDGTLNNGHETVVSNLAVLVLAANPNRKGAVFQNTGTENVRIGSIGVTPTTGIRLIPNASLFFDMPYCDTADVFAIREGGVDSIVLAAEVTA